MRRSDLGEEEWHRLQKSIWGGNSTSSNPSCEAVLRNERNYEEHTFRAVDIATYIALQQAKILFTMGKDMFDWVKGHFKLIFGVEWWRVSERGFVGVGAEWPTN